jgi:hypothetical protein
MYRLIKTALQRSLLIEASGTVFVRRLPLSGVGIQSASKTYFPYIFNLPPAMLLKKATCAEGCRNVDFKVVCSLTTEYLTGSNTSSN